MQQRPRDPEPVAHQPRPRTIRTTWIDHAAKWTMRCITGAVLIATAASSYRR